MICPALPLSRSEIAAEQSIGGMMTTSGKGDDGIGRAAAAEVNSGLRPDAAALEFLESLAILPGGQHNNNRGTSRFQRTLSATRALNSPKPH
jgi:hypothetical protein